MTADSPNQTVWFIIDFSRYIF